MKLLFYLYSLSAGGAERVTATLANYWAGKGWSITVVTTTGRELDFYTLEPAVKRIALETAGNSSGALQALVNNGRRVAALAQVLRHERPEIAIGMMATANATLAIAGRVAGVCTVGSERIHPPTLPLGRTWEWIRRNTYPWLHGMVAQTADSAAWLRDYAPARRIEVIANPLKYPLERHEQGLPPEDVLDKSAGEKLLLAVGRLDEQKGFDRLLTAFARVSNNHPEWGLVILGEGAQRATLIQQAVALGIEDRFALPGSVGNVGEWFEVADLYALTSRFEGFPNTLVEALAYGVPSVAVDCETGPREILHHGVDGLLVPQDDPEALAAALDSLMGDVDLRARFAERAVGVRERFAVQRIAGQWEQLFEECLNGKK
ncbi:MAG: glycosyl transferase [Porticoccaceae bacterium]|nr:glycosyl transferase [Porticoccaceae bacterium]